MADRSTNQDTGKVKLFIRIPKKLHQKFKVSCSENDVSMGDVVIMIIREYMRKKQCSMAIKSTNQDTGKVKFPARIPKDLHQKFKVSCIKNDVFMGDVVIMLIRQYMQKE